jgi:hypothetical protein
MKDKRGTLEAKRTLLIISCTLIHGVIRKNEQKKNTKLRRELGLFRSLL